LSVFLLPKGILMLRFRALSLLVVLWVAGLPLGDNHKTSIEARRAELRDAIEQEWQYTLKTRPEWATAIGDPRYNDRLDDYSAEAEEREAQHARQEIRVFERIDTTGFPEQEALNKTLMLRQLREEVEGAEFKSWEMPVDQMNGPHLDLAALPSQMPFHTVRDYENYLSRLDQIPRALEQVTSNMRLGIDDHLMPPKYLLKMVAAEAQNIAAQPLTQSSFTEPVQKFPSDISLPDQARLSRAVMRAIRGEVKPAYAKFAAFVSAEYAPRGRTQYGVWSLPNGPARYRFDVREMTTTNLAPEQIYELGLKQVAEVEAQMLKLASSMGYHDLKSFNEHIRNDPNLYGKSGRQILELYQHYTDQMYPKLPELFSDLPKTRLEVAPMEAYRAPAAVPADYSPGSGDGKRPGRINVNEYDPTHRLLLNVEAIAYHEGIPGHHLQFSIAQALPGLPAFRRFGEYDAYSEGWAFYAERLGKEVGFYQNPYSEYGRLENEMWRSVRLVVDTGVHYKHWSRQRMIDFFREHTAMDDQNIQTEVDRYIAWPGQALAYKIGQMKILELRERARKALGPKFDIRAFHKAVLDEGPLPLDILDERVNAWIAAQERKP
ncbi:MAG TPA: DUF885 domain-containing protein, partial [Terriglobia bacterium]|nr:DUF885 domain-containing protein [Terriglobia bacterium]